MLNPQTINNQLDKVSSPPNDKNNSTTKVKQILKYFSLTIIVVVIIFGILFIKTLLNHTTSEKINYQNDSQLAPNHLSSCSTNFTTLSKKSEINCLQNSYRNEQSNQAGSYSLTQTQNIFKPGDIIVYNYVITNDGDRNKVITANNLLDSKSSGEFSNRVTFLDSNCEKSHYDGKKITCTTKNLMPGESQSITFRIKIDKSILPDVDIENSLQLSDGLIDQDCIVNISVKNVQEEQISSSPVTKVEAKCGEYCSTNADCISNDQICYFNQCRLAEYPDITDCAVPPVIITNSFVEPSPTINCNQPCLINTDCSDNDHICFENKCRLAKYPASATCTIPESRGSINQPQMPEKLPNSDSDAIVSWIKAGIGVLGAGVLLLLL